jgi:putative pre-16S rRNA nuclease
VTRKSVLAIDHGTKRTGFAVTDPLRITQQPLEPFHGSGESEELLRHIAKLLEEREVGKFLVGLPLNMDGTEGGRAADVRKFMQRLSERFPQVEVVACDERLTTKAAEEKLREAGHRGSAMREKRDSWSALVILEEWMRRER